MSRMPTHLYFNNSIYQKVRETSCVKRQRFGDVLRMTQDDLLAVTFWIGVILRL